MTSLRYSNMQRLGFAGVLVGFLLCVGGAATPYWRVGEVNLGGLTSFFGLNLPFVGGLSLVSLHAGLVWYCFEVVLGDMECQMYTLEHSKDSDVAICSMLMTQILLSLLCLMVALCGQCCCESRTTTFHGITAFLAGGAGFAVVGLFAKYSEDSWQIQLLDASYDWGFYVYIGGACCMAAASFLLCFAAPVTPVGVMMVQPNARPQIVSTTQTQVMNYGPPAPYQSGYAPSYQGAVAPPQSDYPVPYQGAPVPVHSATPAPYRGAVHPSQSKTPLPKQDDPVRSQTGSPVAPHTGSPAPALIGTPGTE